MSIQVKNSFPENIWLASTSPSWPEVSQVIGPRDKKLCTNVIPLMFGAPKGSRRYRGIVVRTDTINSETKLSQVVRVVQYLSLNCVASVSLLPQTIE